MSLTSVRFSGKSALGAFFLRNHKSVTIKVSYADQDLACVQEKVEGTVVYLLKLYGLCIEGQQLNTLRQYAW